MDSGRGGYGGRHYGGGGGGRYRNRRGRGGRHRHHPYHNRSRGPRGGRGNRFNSAQDQQSTMLRQVYSFVSRVGELKNIGDADSSGMRAVESTAATNINDLTAVLCSQDKLDMLLRFQKMPFVSPDVDLAPSERPPFQGKPEFEVGKLVHLLIGCVAGLPLQTPCYAALTLAVHEEVKGGEWEGFAGRCINYAMRHIARDLDMVLLTGSNQAHGVCRIKLMLRYLAILGRMGVVKSYQSEPVEDSKKMTVVGLLSLLVEAATAAAEQRSNLNAAAILSVLVLSTLPYIMEYAPENELQEKILQPLESILQSYRSSFSPGFGSSSILLKEEQLEDDDDDEESDDDDDDDDDDSGGQVCDTLQDLLRVAQLLKNKGGTSRFALPADAPWKGLKKRPPASEEGGPSEPQPIVYEEAPIYLEFSHECQAIRALLSEEGDWKLQCFDLDGVVFGRLPIFGSPPQPDDEEEEADDEMDQEYAKNEQLQAYAKGYNLLDRFFVSDSLRDCIISHESSVAPTGLLRGTARYVAEELLSVCYMLSGGESPGVDGVEYAILETVFALLAQCTETSALQHISLSRVLLELTRLQPARMSPALVVAMSKLFQDYLPSLAPTARDNFSRWFSFHLINTDYQWPSAYWKLWEPYVTSTNVTSRGTFVKRALHLMVENVSTPEVLVNQCLPSDSPLVDHLFESSVAPLCSLPEDSSMASLSQDIMRRLWDENEDSEALHNYLVSDEVVESVTNMLDYSGGDLNRIWWRTGIVIRVIVDPARLECERLKLALQRARQPDEDIMDDDGAEAKDVFSVIADAIGRHNNLMSAVIVKDASDLSQHLDEGKSETELIAAGEAYLLQQVESLASFSRTLLEGCVDCLIRHKVVSGLGVLRWALGDFGGEGKPTVMSRWWEYASIATRGSLMNVLEINDANRGDGDGGMIIDRGTDDVAGVQAKADASLAQLCTLLQYAISQTCKMLETEAGISQKKKLNPGEVDLVIGVKVVVSTSYTILKALLQQLDKTGKSLLPNEVYEMLVDSEVAGAKLVSICEGHDGAIGVAHVKRILQNL